MNAMRIVGVLLLVVEKESVNIPQWMSLGAMVLGGVVLVLGFRKN